MSADPDQNISAHQKPVKSTICTRATVGKLSIMITRCIIFIAFEAKVPTCFKM